MEKINRVAIVGGTHGNELTGAYLVKKFEQFPELIKRPSFETLTLLGNPQAFKAVKRYIDKDLNRRFQIQDLESNDGSTYEDKRAKFINETIGPKGNPQVDFIVDLHNSTAHMGFSIILAEKNQFNLELSSYLSTIEPELKVCIANEQGEDSSFLKSICNRGFTLEVGPVAQGILNAVLFQKTEMLVHSILDYIEKFNRSDFENNKNSVTIYQYLKTVDYPRNEAGELDGMIHPQLQGRDYQKLSPGEPIFLSFNGQTIYYEEEQPVWPIFVNEAAYYEKGIAMCFTKKKTIAF